MPTRKKPGTWGVNNYNAFFLCFPVTLTNVSAIIEFKCYSSVKQQNTNCEPPAFFSENCKKHKIQSTFQIISTYVYSIWVFHKNIIYLVKIRYIQISLLYVAY